MKKTLGGKGGGATTAKEVYNKHQVKVCLRV